MRCFARCIYCQAEAGDQAKTFGEEMNTEQIKRLIKRCDNVGVQTITVVGGEPFLRNDIIEILNYATHLKISTNVSTNGVLLANSEVVENLANAVNRNYFSLQISIEGSKPEVHEHLRPGAKFEKVIRTIENALHYKIHIHTSTLLTKANINDIPNLIGVLEKLGVKIAAFSQFEPMGCGAIVADNLLLSPHELYQFQNKILPILQKKYPNIRLVGKLLEPEFWDEKRSTTPTDKPTARCVACTTDMTIGPDGTVLPCVWFSGFPEFWTENALEKDILDIWKNSKIFKKLRNVEIKGKCEYCKFSRSCYKGCHILKWALHRNIHIPDPKCWYIPGDGKTIYPPKEILETMKPSYQKDLRNKKEIKG
jgi:radical SAM protein with 4Fe4S-binding SPASM domain